MGIDSEKTFDAAIIGGGVIGCAIAWRLAQAGLRSCIIERGKIGAEASSAAGGMLAPLAEADQQDAFFDLAVSSRAIYQGLATELRALTGFDVEYRTEGTLFLALTADDEEELEKRYKWQCAAGLRVEFMSFSKVRELEPLISEKTRWALKFPDDHQVNNRHLLVAIEAAARAAGVVVFENTAAASLIIERSRIRGVLTGGGEIQATSVVVAAGSWSSLVPGAPSAATMAVSPVRGQMIALKAPDPAPNFVIYSGRGYLVPRLGGFLISGSTTEQAGYQKSVTAGGLASIVENAVEIMPAVRSLSIIETWAGLRPTTPDGWPVIGADPEIAGLFYATGHYRNGILLAPVTAEIIRDLILTGVTSLDLAPFSVTRFANRLAVG